MDEFSNSGTARSLAGTHPQHGPQDGSSELGLLRLALNQVDYGLAVVDANTCMLQFANALAHAALLANTVDAGEARHCGLCLREGQLATSRREDAGQLHQALARARNGLRGLLHLGAGGQTHVVAVLPLSDALGDPGGSGTAANPTAHFHALLVFSKRHACDDSTMALFAHERGLTHAEGQVLAQVCRGLRPAQIADHHGVRVSTIRSQLRSIRMKTCSDTIRDLVQKVTLLPPMARNLYPRHNASA